MLPIRRAYPSDVNDEEWLLVAPYLTLIKLMRNTKSPIAETAVRHIAALYAIEADIRGHAPEAQLAVRKKLSPHFLALCDTSRVRDFTVPRLGSESP